MFCRDKEFIRVGYYVNNELKEPLGSSVWDMNLMLRVYALWSVFAPG